MSTTMPTAALPPKRSLRKTKKPGVFVDMACSPPPSIITQDGPQEAAGDFCLPCVRRQHIGSNQDPPSKEPLQKFHRAKIDGSTAAFGTPYHGQRITGRLVYGETKGDYWCREDDYDIPLPLGERERTLPNIVVVRRGNCNFVTKVRIAQEKKEAMAVIVVDTLGSSRTPSEIQRVIMGDDGWGFKVKVPSIFVSDKEGSLLIEELRKNTTDVIVELAWDVPKETTVSMDFWIDLSVGKSINFLQEYSHYAKTLKHKLDFRPHYWIFSLPVDLNDLCIDDDATYCAVDPDMAGSTTGRDVVEETARQLCLWRETAIVDHNVEQSGDYSAIWWNYVDLLPNVCPMDGKGNKAFGQECSFGLMKNLGADMTKINKCLTKDKEAILSRERLNHAWSPLAMRINDWKYSGPLDPEVITQAVCSGFEERPQECDTLLHPTKIGFEEKVDKVEEEQGVPWWIFVVSIIGASIVVVSLFFIYRVWIARHLRKALRCELMAEMKQQMSTDDDPANAAPQTDPKCPSAGHYQPTAPNEEREGDEMNPHPHVIVGSGAFHEAAN
ncbi:unnamed protein product [Vitrella brassicaformis CCMP3155]|uniref:PA domain-containing protein n=1 Tax=Vitrella brassicaformis (strain CCMP3155) TaxID=1169540 RepID=A0A0G4FJ93_VITBC|nr:unnamed protein product [Vitrella brassicaformis CCMP3155]|eukprot:CEM13802.1 unnamed protein product [Vitrella brassicaformis CCMP3155]